MLLAKSEKSRRLSEYSEAVTDERMNGNSHYLKLVNFPQSDHTEITAIRLDSTDSLTKGGGAQRKNTDKESMSTVALKKSQQRAKKTVKYRCLSINAETLVTATFKENVTDHAEAWGCFKYFVKLIRKFYKKHFHFVCVPELQKRGAVHFHIACSGRFDYNFLRRLWRKAAGCRGGNIDVSNKHKGMKGKPAKIAGYIAKYITKSDSVAFNKKRYSSSRGIVLPEPLRGWLPLSMGSEVYYMCSIVENVSHNPVQDIFESDNGRYPYIFIST